MMGLIDAIHSLSKHLPTIRPPERPVTTKEKMMWTGAALVLFFAMYHTMCIGVSHTGGGMDFLQTITAANIGSLLTAGIGPIVLASIFLQLFNGAGLINLDLKDKKDKAKFQETQRVLAIMIAIAEGVIFVVTGRTIVEPVFGLPMEAVMGLVAFQIALGSIIVLFLDEIVSKYGIGSGVGLFIAAGVSQAIMGGLIGLIFASNGVIPIMAEGGAEALPLALLAIMPFVFTMIVFMAVVYAEGVKVEIPIAFERVRGMVPKLPLKFFYVSNIPVIFASALIMNIQFFASAALVDADLPFIGYVTEDGTLRDGLLYMLTPVYGFGRSTTAQWDFITNAVTPFYGIPEWVHALVYVGFLSIFSILFGLFWVETSSMDAKSVAGQLTSSGMQIPGFRRDSRMLEKILNKNIFPLTVMGSFAVGLLAGLADLTGALGTGTGILLTVGILHRMYEQMEQMQAFDVHPLLGKILGD
jgi:preprotein translocase subunit SecY